MSVWLHGGVCRCSSVVARGDWFWGRETDELLPKTRLVKKWRERERERERERLGVRKREEMEERGV
jgi:hypothetical protein